VDNFMASPKYDEIVDLLDQTDQAEAPPPAPAAAATAPAAAPTAEAAAGLHSLLPDQAIVLSGTARTRDEAIDEAGRLLVASGAVEPDYVQSMYEREASVSTYVGNNLAIPHGTNEAKKSIRRTGLSFIRYPDGIDWKGDGKSMAHYVVGIAGAGDDHLSLLGSLAHLFLDKEKVAALAAARTKEEIAAVLDSVSLE
jgi:PTS system mannitol-specific IIC component